MSDKIFREEKPALHVMQRKAGWHRPDVSISKNWFMALIMTAVKALYNYGARHGDLNQLSEESGHMVFQENYRIKLSIL